jgi:hypothetical protein
MTSAYELRRRVSRRAWELLFGAISANDDDSGANIPTYEQRRRQAMQEVAQELKAERRAQPKAHKRATNSSAVPTESNITSLLAGRILKIINSLETVVTPSTWPAAMARAGERSGVRSAPEVSTPRTPAARAAEEPSSGNIVGIFAGTSPTGGININSEFPQHPALQNWKQSIERNRRGADEVRELGAAKPDNQKPARPLPRCRPRSRKSI